MDDKASNLSKFPMPYAVLVPNAFLTTGEVAPEGLDESKLAYLISSVHVANSGKSTNGFSQNAFIHTLLNQTGKYGEKKKY